MLQNPQMYEAVGEGIQPDRAPGCLLQVSTSTVLIEIKAENFEGLQRGDSDKGGLPTGLFTRRCYSLFVYWAKGTDEN